MILPTEYHFDVPAAARQLESLAAKDPGARIVLTLAQLGEDGLEVEADIRLPIAEAAALLATVSESQQLPGRNLFVLRITIDTAVAP